MLLRSVLALVVLAVATADGVLPAARGVPRLSHAIVQKRAVPLSLRGGAAEAAAAAPGGCGRWRAGGAEAAACNSLSLSSRASALA